MSGQGTGRAMDQVASPAPSAAATDTGKHPTGRIRRGFVEIEEGQVHYREAGEPRPGHLPLVLYHARHTSAEFVAFLTDIVANQPRSKEIHVIADNLSAHKTKHVQAFLAEHPQVHMHFTPTYSSWLNQVELWFAKIERDVIARGVFPSVPDLMRKLMRYMRKYNEQPKPVKWKYFDPTRRITPDLLVRRRAEIT
jgi:transposase